MTRSVYRQDGAAIIQFDAAWQAQVSGGGGTVVTPAMVRAAVKKRNASQTLNRHEIAILLGISYTLVQRHEDRAMAKLKDLLADCAWHEPARRSGLRVLRSEREDDAGRAHLKPAGGPFTSEDYW